MNIILKKLNQKNIIFWKMIKSLNVEYYLLNNKLYN